MPKPGRTWFPLDVGFWRDPKVIAAGERAGVLYQAMLGQIRLTGSPGTITDAEVKSLGITQPGPRLNALLKVGLVRQNHEGYVVPAWDSWQRPGNHAAYMRDWRAQRKENTG